MGNEILIYICLGLGLILAAVLTWAIVATKSVRTWSERARLVEKTMAELPRMQQVLSTLPRCAEDHALVAAIVESRTHRNLIPVIRNVRQVLPGTPIRVFHGNLNRGMLLEALRREIDADEVRLIPLGLEGLNMEQYNLLMTSPRYYEACDGRHVLVFQTDAVLFSRSRVKLDEFIGFDYVGAAWQECGESSFRANSFRALPPINRVGNGGLSLRRREKMIETAVNTPYLSTPFIQEDVYFAHALPAHGAVLPSVAQSARFSFEQVLGTELPFGAHKYMPKDFRDQIRDEERAIIENHTQEPA